jgi:ferredoxin
MPQYFDRCWNVPIRLLLFGAPALLAAAGGALAVGARSPAVTSMRQPVKQPIPFSHRYHVGELALDCRYCHDTVEQLAFAGMPASGVCMDCHRRVWTGLNALAPLRASEDTSVPLAWRRVHDLPDYACFDHSIHVQKGFACVTCHGRVDRMPVTWQAESLSMNWCLDCHREPERFVRPRAHVFDMAWQRPTDPQELRALSAEAGIEPPVTNPRALGKALVAKYRIARKTNCSDCHR